MTGPDGKHRAVFLDRDGVLNRSDVCEGKPFAPLRVEEFDILPGVADAVGDLKAAGFLVIVTTNQKDVGEGLASMEVLEAMHDKLRAEVDVDDICVCTCGDHCRRYKPNPGMLMDAARQWNIDLAASIMVGDRWRDVDAGKAADCLTYFIDCGYNESLNQAPDHTVSDLPEAVRHILKSLSVEMGTSMTKADSLNVKIFADGADLDGIRKLAQNPLIKGFTTNPTLMRKAGISDYAAFAKDMLGVIGGAPVSFEVFADEFDEMEAQALEIASWGDNVYVKIPITNTKGEPSVPLVERLSAQKVQVNVTAMMTLDQMRHVAEALHEETPAVVSVFAGRIADTGIDPVPLMREAVGILESRPKAELLWASPRELLNIFHADEVDCHIITVTHDLLGKLKGVGKDLDQFSLETVQMFYNDASAAGYTITTDKKATAAG